MMDYDGIHVHIDAGMTVQLCEKTIQLAPWLTAQSITWFSLKNRRPPNCFGLYSSIKVGVYHSLPHESHYLAANPMFRYQNDVFFHLKRVIW